MSEPNIQNIPLHTEEGRAIRNAFIGEAGRKPITPADYFGIELRILDYAIKIGKHDV